MRNLFFASPTHGLEIRIENKRYDKEIEKERNDERERERERRERVGQERGGIEKEGWGEGKREREKREIFFFKGGYY